MQFSDTLIDLSDTSQSVSFEDWLMGRRTFHLSTNAGSEPIAFQSWRNFKEAFAPELIGIACEETSTELERPIKKCIDPFGGSGTTALACQFLGIIPTTIEVNPYLADLVEAKLCSYDVEELILDFKNVMADSKSFIGIALPGTPPTFVEPGVKGRYIFSKDVAARLTAIRQCIMKLSNDANKRLMRVLLGGISITVSNVLISGKGRRYKKNWEDKTVAPEMVDQLFMQAVSKAIFEIRRFEGRKAREYNLLRGDSRNLIPPTGDYDLAIFSPPYPNSFDYTDVYNVELWVCDYLKSNDDNRNLRMATLRSHVQVSRSYECSNLQSETLSLVANRLTAVEADLWDKSIPSMVSAYFSDMHKILHDLKNSLVKGGRVYMVVGDSR